MSEIKVKRCRPVSDEIRVPGDKSISHRAVMLSAISNGPCEVSGFLPSADCLATVDAFRAMGVRIAREESGEGTARLRIEGKKGRLASPDAPIDCGNSGTTMRLLSGILAGQPEGFRAELVGDESLMKRPMRRIVEPLQAMGARIEATGEGGTAPLRIEGGALHGIDYALPVASAQVKSAVLLAALFAEGKTTVAEPTPSRDHTERMLGFFQVHAVRKDNEISLEGRQVLESRNFLVPGDMSSAAFWVAMASAMPGAHLCIHGVGLNETRTGILKTLIRMGAQITEVVDEMGYGEPIGRIEVHGGRLRGTVIEGSDIPNVIDELPIIAVAAALAEGKTVIRDAKELRVKESDRIASVTNNLQAMGVTVREFFDGMEIEGGCGLRGARLDSFGDHRIAMAFAVAGLFAHGETIIERTECVDTSYPGFAEQLKRFMIEKKGGSPHIPVINSLNPEGNRDFRRPGRS